MQTVKQNFKENKKKRCSTVPLTEKPHICTLYNVHPYWDWSVLIVGMVA
jgi:hypothetical protein